MTKEAIEALRNDQQEKFMGEVLIEAHSRQVSQHGNEEIGSLKELQE